MKTVLPHYNYRIMQQHIQIQTSISLKENYYKKLHYQKITVHCILCPGQNHLSMAAICHWHPVKLMTEEPHLIKDDGDNF